jgi:hypothetical protein
MAKMTLPTVLSLTESAIDLDDLLARITLPTTMLLRSSPAWYAR